MATNRHYAEVYPANRGQTSENSADPEPVGTDAPQTRQLRDQQISTSILDVGKATVW